MPEGMPGAHLMCNAACCPFGVPSDLTLVVGRNSPCSVRVLGGLKMGKKKLYVYHGAQLHELTPDCV